MSDRDHDLVPGERTDNCWTAMICADQKHFFDPPDISKNIFRQNLCIILIYVQKWYIKKLESPQTGKRYRRRERNDRHECDVFGLLYDDFHSDRCGRWISGNQVLSEKQDHRPFPGLCLRRGSRGGYQLPGQHPERRLSVHVRDVQRLFCHHRRHAALFAGVYGVFHERQIHEDRKNAHKAECSVYHI